jgi:hypothetical protein
MGLEDLLVLSDTLFGMSAPQPTTSHMGWMAMIQNNKIRKRTMRVKRGSRRT